MVARVQARYWHQEWTITWETYRTIMLPYINQMGRKKDSWNLIRIDRNLPWTETNVIAAQRKTVVERKKAGHRRYLPEHELERRRVNMEKYKLKGYTGKRYKRYDTEDTK